jgi:hypothetical protein
MEYFFCYIRYPGKPWKRGAFHHDHALLSYCLMKDKPARDVRISVPHIAGGWFVAYFSKVNDVVYQYRDETGTEVEIMMARPEKVAFINRVIDY